MKELSLHETYAVSGGNDASREMSIITNTLLLGIMGFTGAVGIQMDPFYPTVIFAAYAFVMSSFAYSQG